MWHLCSGGESQLHSHLQYGLSLFREPLFHSKHCHWSSGFDPAFDPAFAAQQRHHQPHRDPLQPLIQPRSLSCLPEQPWTSLSKPHLYSREQGQWHHRWELPLLICWRLNILVFAQLVNYFIYIYIYKCVYSQRIFKHVDLLKPTWTRWP